MPAKYTPKQQIAAFWSKVKLPEQIGTDECWEWQARRHARGYGQVTFNKKVWQSNRLAWVFLYGFIPDGMHVLHTCDNPPCCNPNHLWLGTHDDNMRDRALKLRCANTKLTPKQVNEIRTLLSAGQLSHREISLQFEVSRQLITLINNDLVWRYFK